MNQPHSSDQLDPRNMNPLNFKISAKDQRVIKQCNKEAFFSRSLPLSTVFGGITYLAVKSGYFKPHAKWGPIPKVCAAVMGGYFIGKISYQKTCAEKLMAIPDSELGAALRARRDKGRSGVFQEPLPGYGFPDYSTQQETPQDEYHDDFASRPFSSRPYNQDLDDTFRMDVDSPQRPEDFSLPPQSSGSNTYDEMRRRNREDFEKKASSYRRPYEAPPRQYQPPPAAGVSSDNSDRFRPTNIYGDIIEK